MAQGTDIGAHTNPMVASRNKLKLGVFAINSSGGCAITTAPESHRSDNWKKNLNTLQIADRAGYEAAIPVGRWRGFDGASNFSSVNYETYTWAAAVAASTERIACVSTSHVQMVHPLFAAKQATTIDHVCNGRFGLNIICGWFAPEMEMFGGKMMEHDTRYEYADDWLAIVNKAWTEERYFDYRGKYFEIKHAFSQPKPINRPFLINAGGSARGMRYCAQHCDAAFIILRDHELKPARAQIDTYKKLARDEFGRDLKVWCYTYVSLGDTEAEGKKYVDRYAVEFGDDVAAGNIMREVGLQTGIFTPEQVEQFRYHFKAGRGGAPLVGTPKMVTDRMEMMSEAGMDGICLSWLDYNSGIKQFNAEVLPLLEKSGLREPDKRAMAA